MDWTPEAWAAACRRLVEPFDPSAVRWRVGQVAKNGQRCTLLAYVTARDVAQRLDDAVGPHRWSAEYRHVVGGVMCRLSILTPSGWVAKEDGADPTDVEGFKGAVSDALKRAAVHWGPARYLYEVESEWHELSTGRRPDDAISVPVKEGGQRVYKWVRPPTRLLLAPPTPEPQPDATDPHDEHWERDKKRLMAVIGNHGLKYEQVKAWCLDHGKPKPSAAGYAAREALIKWLPNGGADRIRADLGLGEAA